MRNSFRPRGYTFLSSLFTLRDWIADRSKERNRPHLRPGRLTLEGLEARELLSGFPTTTGLVSSVNPAYDGQPVVLTAHVTSPNGPPTGAVVFLDGTTAIGTATVSNGFAILS